MSEVPLYTGSLEDDLAVVSRNEMAEKITGGLSHNSKMPCASWGIPAARCRVGALLAKKPNTVCGDCYAMKGRYRFGKVQEKLDQRYEGAFDPLWTPSMVFLILFYCDEYFRWFDSGDIAGENHLQNINTVARHTPEIKLWLPTREYATVQTVREKIGDFASNLTIRVSGHMIDGPAPNWWPSASCFVGLIATITMDARMAMMPITSSSSMRVKPARRGANE